MQKKLPSRVSGQWLHWDCHSHSVLKACPTPHQVTNSEYHPPPIIAHGFVTGRFPRRVRSPVPEWYQQHREELMLDWERARRREPISPIAPLE